MGNKCCVPGTNAPTSGNSVLNKQNQPLLNQQNLKNNQNLTTPENQAKIGSLKSQPPKQKAKVLEKNPFDDYQQLANLGKGAYGEVSLVRKKKDGKLFAMKVVKKEKVAINRKMVEATLLDKHPFIVKLSQSFQTEGKLYIIMEYMANGDLYSVLQKAQKFDENTARFIFAQVNI